MLLIGQMRMIVLQVFVAVNMRMLSAHLFAMNVVVVSIAVAVPMVMLCIQVNMLMGMIFSDGQIRAGQHDKSRYDKSQCHRLIKQDHG